MCNTACVVLQIITNNYDKHNVFNTYAIHPADVSGGTGENGGLLGVIAAVGRHKAGHTMDNPAAVDAAVQGSTRVTLGSGT